MLSRCSSATTELLLLCNHGLYTIVHILNEINLRTTETALVGDIIDMISRLRVFTVDATNLNMELISNLFELSHLCTEFGKCNMHRGTQGRSKVSRARCDIAKMVIVSKSGHSLDMGSSL